MHNYKLKEYYIYSKFSNQRSDKGLYLTAVLDYRLWYEIRIRFSAMLANQPALWHTSFFHFTFTFGKKETFFLLTLNFDHQSFTYTLDQGTASVNHHAKHLP